MNSAADSSDRTRQLIVAVSEVFCIIATLIGIGLFGGVQVKDAAGGALAADATLIAPAVQAFGIWTPVYLGLAAYTVWQWLPSQAARPRQRRVGWWVAVTMILNGLWLLCVQAGWLWASVLVIAVLVGVLGLTMALLHHHPAESWVEKIVLDGTMGLYLGWVCVATCANVTAALVDAGVSLGSLGNQIAAVVVLLVAGAVGVVLAQRLGARWAIMIALAWGLGWVAVGRLTDQPASTVVGITAALVALALAAQVAVRRLGRSAPSHA